MAAGDREIRQRIRVDNQASPELRRVADDTKQLGDATQQSGQQATNAAQGQNEYARSAGDAGHSASSADTAITDLGASTKTTADETDTLEASTGELDETTGGLTERIGGMVSGWLSFTAIAGGIVRWIQQINEESREASEAVHSLGNRLNDLAINLGPGADQITRHANQLANTEQERDALVDFAAEMTDRRPELINDLPALEKMMEKVLPVQQITQPGGTELAEIYTAFEGAGFRDTYDAMAYFGAAGLGGRKAVDILEQVGPERGREALEMMLAARQTGNIPNRAIRQLPQLFTRLNEIDPETGELTETLQAMGITTDMSLAEQVQQAGEAFAAGDTAQRQAIREALLPRHTDAVLPPLTEAIAGGKLQGVREGLREARSEDIAAVRLESELRREAEMRDRLKFRQRLVEEDSEEARRAFLQDTLEQIRWQRGDIAPMRWLTGAASSFQTEGALERDLNSIMRGLLQDDPDAFAQIFPDLPRDIQAGIVPGLLDERSASEQRKLEAGIEQLPLDLRRRLHELHSNMNDDRVWGRGRERGEPVFLDEPFPTEQAPTPEAGSRRQGSADGNATAMARPTGGQGVMIDAATARDLQATLEGLRTALATDSLGERHTNITNIGTNYAGWRDPRWADIEPVHGMG